MSPVLLIPPADPLAIPPGGPALPPTLVANGAVQRQRVANRRQAPSRAASQTTLWQRRNSSPTRATADAQGQTVLGAPPPGRHEVGFGLGREEFRLFLLPRTKGRPKPVEVTRFTTAVNWDDSSPILSGDFAMVAAEAAKVKLAMGDLMQLQARPFLSGRWAEVWRLKVSSVGADIKSGSRSYTLGDDFQNLAASTDDFRFVRTKGKGHPRGWLVHEAVKSILSRYGIPIGALPKMRARVTKYTKTGVSPLDVITDLFAIERRKTGKRYVIRLRRGKFWCTELQRSKVMFSLSNTIVEGSLGLAKRDDFATVLTVRSAADDTTRTDAKGHKVRKHRKIHTQVRRAAIVKRFGMVHQIVEMTGLDSVHEARKRGLAELGKRVAPDRTLSLTHAGILGLRRGQAVKLSFKDLSLGMVVWVTSVRHTLAPGQYNMDVTLTFSDPFRMTRADKLAARRSARASKHGRKSDQPARKPRPKPKRAAKRR